MTVLLRRMIRNHLRRLSPEKSSMYSSEYTSGLSGLRPRSGLPPSPRDEGNVGQAPGRMLKKSASSRSICIRDRYLLQAWNNTSR